MKEIIAKFKQVFSCVREYKKFALVTPIFMAIEAAAETFIPSLGTRLITDVSTNVIKDASSPKLWFYVGMLLGLAIISIIAGICGGVFAAKASAGLARNIRHDLYSKLESFSFANIDKFESSSLITRMTTDIQNATMSFQMVIRIVIRAPLMLIFSVIMAFVEGGNLAWVFIGLIPLVGGAFILICRAALPVFRRVFKKYDKLNKTVEENISGIRVVKSYVREDYEQEKFNKASTSISKEFLKAERIVALNNPVMNTCIHLSNILLLTIGSYAIIMNSSYDGEHFLYGTISPAAMSACITYGVQILMQLMMITMISVMLIISVESVRRIGEVLEEEPTIKNSENPIFELDDGSVEFDHVNFKYSEKAERNALENINISIKSGSFVGILGATGSGKTSFVNLISRLYDISSGSLKVGGHDVKEYDLKSLRDSVAVVLQKNVLFSGTISSNLRWGKENATDEEIQEACKIAQADEFVQTFPDKYETKIEQGGTNVSGGQKQRLCIARALLKNPKILILDDSTSAVDTKTDALIRKGLNEQIPNTTKIVVAQRISSIQSADLIIIFENGSIKHYGTHEELMKIAPSYKETYEAQNKKGGK